MFRSIALGIGFAACLTSPSWVAAEPREAPKAVPAESRSAPPPRTEPAPPERSTPDASTPQAREGAGRTPTAEPVDPAASARGRADEAQRRTQEAASPKRPNAAQTAPVERSEIPDGARRNPGLAIASSVADVAWGIQGLAPCHPQLPCPGLEGELAIPMTDFGAVVGDVGVHVADWSGYKALTFGVSDPDSRVVPRFHDPKGAKLETVLWATAGSQLPLYLTVANEGGPAMWEVQVSLRSSVEPAVSKRFRVRLNPPLKQPGEDDSDVADTPAGDCNILQGACGADLRSVTVSGDTFARAVWSASAAQGKTPFEVESGACGPYDGSFPTAKVELSPAGGVCEFKLFTGGKSHSKMRKHCLIESWDTSQVPYQGVPPIEVALIDGPDPWTRQKQWHVRLTGAPMSPTYQAGFAITWVNLMVPDAAPNLTANDDAGLREFCFQ